MSATRYNVVFSGVIYPGKNREAVKKNLGRLLSLESSQVDELFANKGTVIRQSTDLETAVSFVKLFEEAGAVCTMQVADGKAQPLPEKKSAPAARPAPTLGVVNVEPVPADPLYSPSTVPKIGAWDQGLDTNRMDNPHLDFADIRLVSVFGRPLGEEKQYTLFLFLAGQRRPFQVDASKIVFTEFHGVKSQMLLASLRNFLFHLLHHAPQIMLDGPTYDFLRGQSPVLLKQDPLILATSLGKFMGAGDGGATATRLPIPPRNEEVWKKAREQDKARPAKALYKPPPPKVEGQWRGPTLDMITSRLPPASVGLRMLAAFHTLVLAASLVLCFWIPIELYMITHYGVGIKDAYDQDLPCWVVARGLLLLTAVACAFYVEVLSAKPDGQSYGQKLAGIRVVTAKGEPAHGLDIWFLRFLGHAVQVLSLGVVLILSLYTTERASLADHFSGTRQVALTEKTFLLWQALPALLCFTLANTAFSYKKIWNSIPEGVVLWSLGVLFWLAIFFGYRAWKKNLYPQGK